MSQTHIYDESYEKTLFGFWVYLLSDFVLFGALFATYLVLKESTYGGPNAHILLQKITLAQTLLLLMAAFTSGLGKRAIHCKDKKGALIAYTLTFLFGVGFALCGSIEWNTLVSAGHTWKESAFLSAFFTLIGTFFLHIFFALLFLPIFLWPLFRERVTPLTIKRLSCLTLFWQFLNCVWIFIFSIVYLWGSL